MKLVKGYALAILAIAVCGLVACSGKTEAPQPIEIRLQRISSQHMMRVTWRLPAAANALVFTRGESFRSGQWDAQDGFHLEQVSGKDVLRADSPTSVFQIDIHEGLSEVRSDYPLMMPFSDGGLVFFTGHLDAAWLNCYQECSSQEIASVAGRPSPINMVLVPADGERVISGQTISTTAFSPGSPPQGLMVYFGTKVPLKGPGYRYISDPKVPLWALVEFKDLFPRVLDLVGQRLGRILPMNPIVMIPFVPGQKRLNSTYSGAVAGDSILLGLYSDRWSTETQGAKDELKKLVAHESFHLWNATLFHSVEPEAGTWLHEGSADAMAYQILLDLGAISRQRYLDFQTEALNRCAVGLSGTSLPESTKIWNSRNHYDCGAVIEYAVALSLRQKNSDLWDLWSKIFDQASLSGGVYNQSSFFSLAQQMTESATAVMNMQSLASGQTSFRTDNPQLLELFFINSFSPTGANLRADYSQTPKWYGHWTAERALAMTIDSDCEDGNWYYRNDDGLTVVGRSSCRSLRADTVIREIGGYSVNDEGVEVYDLMSNTCGSQGSRLEMTSSAGGRLDFACPNIPHRPNYLVFSSTLN